MQNRISTLSGVLAVLTLLGCGGDPMADIQSLVRGRDANVQPPTVGDTQMPPPADLLLLCRHHGHWSVQPIGMSGDEPVASDDAGSGWNQASTPTLRHRKHGGDFGKDCTILSCSNALDGGAAPDLPAQGSAEVFRHGGLFCQSQGITPVPPEPIPSPICTEIAMAGAEISVIDGNTRTAISGAQVSLCDATGECEKLDENAAITGIGTGIYVGAYERAGRFTLKVAAEGYTTFSKSIAIEKDECHVMTVKDEVALYKEGVR